MNQKLISQINSIGLFALVFGFLGQIFGMIQVFDAIEFGGSISPSVLGGGIKITALSPSFGMFVFLVGRLGTILITAFKK
jgi:biopolymer transport protein ExbB/TolQ